MLKTYSDAGSIGFPVPSMYELYVNQTNFTIPGQNYTIYLWDEYKEVYNGTSLVDLMEIHTWSQKTSLCQP